MPQRFTLEIVRMECVNEQAREWGKDEMRLLGFGVSREGHFFSTGYRDLGSYGSGDVKPPGSLPQTLLPVVTQDLTFQRSKRLGHYAITLRTTYRRVDVAIG